MPSRKQYVRERYLPCRKAKIDHKFYNTKTTTNFYHNKLSSLLPHVHFTFNDFDLEYDENKDKKNRINIPCDSNLHNMQILKKDHNHIIMTILYDWTDGNQHMSMLIADTINKRIEWFDTYNTYKYIYEPIKKKIQRYFPKYHIVKVHQRIIQEDDDDHYCQSWPYYYMYKRLYKKKTMKSIVGKLMEKDKKRRIDVIRNFHYKISKNIMK